MEKKIWFFDNSTCLESTDDLKTRARGGMVSSLFRIPDELAKLGYDCRVYADIKTEGVTASGIRWIPYNQFPTDEADYLVCNRGTGPDGFLMFKAKRRILWTHDLPHAGFIPEKKTVRAFHRTVFMSKYAERVWRALFEDIGRSVIIPNGVDKTVFYPREKDLNYLIYGSAPNRGLNHLALIFESLRSRCRPELYMRAYTNMDTMHPKEAELDRRDLFWQSIIPLHYKTCHEAGIEVMDPLPQAQWAEEIGKSGLMIMPSDYAEICSNNVLQALASGTPVVTTGGIGSVGEWVKSGYNGYLSKWKRSDYMIHLVDLIRGAMRILNDEKLHRKMIKNAVKTKNILTWEEVARKWGKLLN